MPHWLIVALIVLLVAPGAVIVLFGVYALFRAPEPVSPTTEAETPVPEPAAPVTFAATPIQAPVEAEDQDAT
jgi:hypothetical protein